MANEEQLNILKKGAKVWNQWRLDHPDEVIDLQDADLEHIEFGNAVIDLAHANLDRVQFSKAPLQGAALNGSSLRQARLFGASFDGADLTGADLEGANLQSAILRSTTVCRANLRNADLIEASLVGADFSGAVLTGTKLYGAARDDWTITGVECDYVFWAQQGKTRTPAGRDFEPGEFEELYKQPPSFDYYFQAGFTPIDAIVMDRVVHAINERHPEFALKLVTLDARGQPHATFTVRHFDDTAPALSQVTAEYETKLRMLEGQKAQLMEVLLRAVERPQIVGQIINVGRDYFERIDGHAQVTTGSSAGTASVERSETP